MIDIQYIGHFIDPFDENLLNDNWALSKNYFYSDKRPLNLLEISNYNLIIIGIALDDKNENFSKLRKELYNSGLIKDLLLCDLGNIKPEADINEKIKAFEILYHDLAEIGKTLLILSDSEKIGQIHFENAANNQSENQFTLIDKKLQLFTSASSLEHGYMGKLAEKYPKISNITALGTQEYYTQEEEKEFMNKKNFIELRLGKLKENILLAEPSIRNSKLINYNLNVLQEIYMPDLEENSPNGLDSRESCIISSFCAQADFLQSISYYPLSQKANIKLSAQIIWYFLKSFSQKIIEIPNAKNLSFTKFVVNYHENNTVISFLKSNITNRWWIEIRYKKNKPVFFPSSYDEYQKIKNNQIPDEWLNYMNKISQSKKK